MPNRRYGQLGRNRCIVHQFLGYWQKRSKPTLADMFPCVFYRGVTVNVWQLSQGKPSSVYSWVGEAVDIYSAGAGMLGCTERLANSSVQLKVLYGTPHIVLHQVHYSNSVIWKGTKLARISMVWKKHIFILLTEIHDLSPIVTERELSKSTTVLQLSFRRLRLVQRKSTGWSRIYEGSRKNHHVCSRYSSLFSQSSDKAAIFHNIFVKKVVNLLLWKMRISDRLQMVGITTRKGHLAECGMIPDLRRITSTSVGNMNYGRRHNVRKTSAKHDNPWDCPDGQE